MFFDADRSFDLDLSSNGKAMISWHLTRTGISTMKLFADFVSKAIILLFIARCLYIIHFVLVLFQMHCKNPFSNLITILSKSTRDFYSYTLLYMYKSYTFSCRLIMCILFDLPVHHTQPICDKIYLPLHTCPNIHSTVRLTWLIMLLTALSIFGLPNFLLEYNIPVFVTKRLYFTPDCFLLENISQFTCFTVRPYCIFRFSLFRPHYNVYNKSCCTFALFFYQVFWNFLGIRLYIWSCLITYLYWAFYVCVYWLIRPLCGFILLFFRPLFGFEHFGLVSWMYITFIISQYVVLCSCVSLTT